MKKVPSKVKPCNLCHQPIGTGYLGYTSWGGHRCLTPVNVVELPCPKCTKYGRKYPERVAVYEA